MCGRLGDRVQVHDQVPLNLTLFLISPWLVSDMLYPHATSGGQGRSTWAVAYM